MPLERTPFELTYPGEPGRVVRGRVVRPASADGPLPWVLVLHGFKGFMDWGFFPVLARRLAESGLATVLFNTSGSGIGPDLESFTEEEAFATATLSRQLEDTERVRAFVTGGGVEGLDLDRAGLYGHSRGGGLGLIHAAECGAYRALATWSAIDDADRYGDAVKAAWRREGSLPIVNTRTGQVLRLDVEVLEDFERHRDRFDIPAACGRISAPTLALHGAEDESVPPTALERIGGALRNPRTHLVPDAGHTFGAVHPLQDDPLPGPLTFALDETVAWLTRHLGGPGA